MRSKGELMATETGFCFDDRYLQHNTGLMKTGREEELPFVDPVLHLSNHRLVMRTRQLVDLAGLDASLTPIQPRFATDEELLVYHTEEYLNRIRSICEVGGGEAGEGTPVSKMSEKIARLAAGGSIATVDAVLSGQVKHAFANIRPPGHHAMRSQAMGYCIFNNAVAAVHHARKRHGINRVMVLDWDVHHGNGTQDAFYHDPSVLFVSIHQESLYPVGWGNVDEVGADEGAGYNVNVPLPAGSGDATYQRVFEAIIRPIVHEFKPELILVSAGQDASAMDVLGRMALTTEAYRWMTTEMMLLAEQHAGGRLVILQEGGYSEVYAPYCSLAIIDALLGAQTDFSAPTPIEYLSLLPTCSIVSSAAEEAIANVQAAYRPYWSVI
jgi:acetoin utilization deacetylase AcuC-like enzyme